MINYIQLVCCLIELESGGKADAVGDNGNAIGCLQLHRCVVKEVNRVCGTRWRPGDRKDVGASIAIARSYLQLLGEHYKRVSGHTPTVQALARMFNGGPDGWAYPGTADYGRRAEALYRTMAPATVRSAVEKAAKADAEIGRKRPSNM